MLIRKKAWPELFELVITGKKKFDLRLADFDVSEGDTFVFEEWDPNTKEYTGRKIEKKVGFVLKLKPTEFWSQQQIDKQGLYVLQLD